jgi:hypothetical protein
MIDITLQALPNQSFSIQLGESRYDITLKEANGVMSASVVRDGTPVVENVRLVAGSPLLPYRYLEDGNFVLFTQDDDLPYYTAFGVTQFLTYLTADEVAALRG